MVRELAQMVERLTFNQLVVGLIPTLPTPYENQFLFREGEAYGRGLTH